MMTIFFIWPTSQITFFSRQQRSLDFEIPFPSQSRFINRLLILRQGQGPATKQICCHKQQMLIRIQVPCVHTGPTNSLKAFQLCAMPS